MTYFDRLLKPCSKCDIVKPLYAFIKNKECSFGRTNVCSECDNLYKSAYYKRNIKRKRRLANELNRSKKDKAIEYMGGKCVDCGGVFDRCCYDFHHIGDKDGNPSKFLTGSWDKAEKEIQKCVLLCANCHRIRHFKEDT